MKTNKKKRFCEEFCNQKHKIDWVFNVIYKIQWWNEKYREENSINSDLEWTRHGLM